MTNGWASFNKYVGIQGVIALAMVTAYIAAIFVQVNLPEGYTELMTFIFGTYFTKNGSNIAQAVKGKFLRQ